MHNADVLAPHSKEELPAVVAKLFAAVPAEQRGGREQCLYVFAAGDTFIFEYKAFQADGGAERKVLLWLMLRGGQLRRLTFKGLSQDSREFE